MASTPTLPVPGMLPIIGVVGCYTPDTPTLPVPGMLPGLGCGWWVASGQCGTRLSESIVVVNSVVVDIVAVVVIVVVVIVGMVYGPQHPNWNSYPIPPVLQKYGECVCPV